MGEVLAIVRKHQVCIDPNIMVCVVTTMVLEGWQFRLDPELVMIDHISDTLDLLMKVEDLMNNFGAAWFQTMPLADAGSLEAMEAV